MNRLIDSLQVYPITMKAFAHFLQSNMKIDANKFISTANNAVAIFPLIAFIEHSFEIDFIDVVYYTRFHKKLGFADCVKEGIKVVFYFNEKKMPFNFDLF